MKKYSKIIFIIFIMFYFVGINDVKAGKPSRKNQKCETSEESYCLDLIPFPKLRRAQQNEREAKISRMLAHFRSGLEPTQEIMDCNSYELKLVISLNKRRVNKRKKRKTIPSEEEERNYKIIDGNFDRMVKIVKKNNKKKWI